MGLYQRLLCAQWSTGSLPDDDTELTSYGKGGTPLARVRAKFEKCPDGRLRNVRMEIERAKQAAYRMVCAEAGRKGGGNPNFQKGKPNPYKLPLSTGDKGKDKGRINPPSPSPVSDPVSDPVSVSNGEGKASRALTFKPPIIEEVKLQAAKIGCSETEAFKFHAHFESNGWRVGANPMRDWRAAMQKWHLNGPRFGTHQRAPQQHTENLPIKDL